jgi:hypothetical protein
VVGAAGEVVVDVPAEKLGAPFVFCTASSGFPNDANDAAGALGGSLSFGVGAVNENEGGVGFSAAGAAEVKADEKPPLVGELLGGESEPSSMKGFGAPVAC